MKYALGIIETVGLAAAIEAADTAVKSANVKLIGYELTKGDGMATVKIEGDVGAVKAGIESAKSSAALVSKVIGFRVIPRPSDDLESLIRNKETVGYAEVIVENTADLSIEIQNDVEADLDEVSPKKIDIAEKKSEVEKNSEADRASGDDSFNLKSLKAAESLKSEESLKSKENLGEICNICHDPNCTRKKGEQRRFCIHYFDHRK